MTSEQKRDAIIAAADDKKANYVTQIDLRGKTVIADYFIICTGTSNIHIRSVADGIVEALEKVGVRPKRTEGYVESTWIIVAYDDVIVHVMSDDERKKYNLESLWTRELKFDPSGQAMITPSSVEGREDGTAA
jgi:ribosome-associated protein